MDEPVLYGGSSPHAWGTHSSFLCGCSPSRFIPTCVGNSLAHGTVLLRLPVHPHMRGELSYYRTARLSLSGSSPHAWGTHHQQADVVRVARFIPTCVGNSPRDAICRKYGTVHPHMRGELSGNFSCLIAFTGSSPHAWGTPEDSPCNCSPCWFIPTCVGNSNSGRSFLEMDTVHPHMRGELELHHSAIHFISGSSPHAWGTPCLCASSRRSTPVHPHMRGELHRRVKIITGYYGSSPHAWGTLDLLDGPVDVLRFIPTCVGNSLYARRC